jgi:hypothetical protein
MRVPRHMKRHGSIIMGGKMEYFYALDASALSIRRGDYIGHLLFRHLLGSDIYVLLSRDGEVTGITVYGIYEIIAELTREEDVDCLTLAK